MFGLDHNVKKSPGLISGQTIFGGYMSESYKSLSMDCQTINLPDIQNTKSNHQIYLPKVGIQGLKLPIMIMDKNGGHQITVADISINVDLKPNVKGISMSRLVEEAHKYSDKEILIDDLVNLAEDVRKTSESRNVQIKYSFPYFIRKKAPVSNISGYIHHDVTFSVNIKDNIINRYFEVCVLATSLCPCSKEISEAGAHNQKCYISAKFKPKCFIWLEDIIKVLENCASSPIYSIVKRPDEKYITEYAYNHPTFVEDVARNSYYELSKIEPIECFRVTVRSDESIHVHQAMAVAEFGEIHD